MKKKDKNFWLLLAGVTCILIYILIPLLKILGVISEYNSGLTSFLLIAGAVLYLASRRGSMQKKEEEEEAKTEEAAAEAEATIVAETEDAAEADEKESAPDEPGADDDDI